MIDQALTQHARQRSIRAQRGHENRYMPRVCSGAGPLPIGPDFPPARARAGWARRRVGGLAQWRQQVAKHKVGRQVHDRVRLRLGGHFFLRQKDAAAERRVAIDQHRLLGVVARAEADAGRAEVVQLGEGSVGVAQIDRPHLRDLPVGRRHEKQADDVARQIAELLEKVPRR